MQLAACCFLKGSDKMKLKRLFYIQSREGAGVMRKSLAIFFDLFLMVIGTALFAFGLVTFNIPNHLAEGGVTGITLILKALLGWNPAYTTFLLNIPLILIGGKILGKRSFAYTIFGTTSLSVFLWIWQRLGITLDVHHDLLIACLLAGLFSGLGSGLVYRAGGTTGGADIVARILEKKKGTAMGRTLLAFDCLVLLVSLIYIDLQHMMYTLIASYVFSSIVNYVIDGAYAAKGVLAITEQSNQIALKIMTDLDRGVSFLKGKGGYSNSEKDILYCVVSPREIVEIKRIIETIDPDAFISIFNVHEARGEGFSYRLKNARRQQHKH